MSENLFFKRKKRFAISKFGWLMSNTWLLGLTVMKKNWCKGQGVGLEIGIIFEYRFISIIGMD